MSSEGVKANHKALMSPHLDKKSCGIRLKN